MDIPLGSDAAYKFVTNVGLITTNGPNGPNVMACEWTHHIAHDRGLILISVSADSTTAENISATREFGVSLAAEGHNIVASIAGGSHGREVNKIALLAELGLELYNGRVIDAPMISGAALNAECRVVEMKEMGGQLVVIGEAIDVQVSDQGPLVYHGGRYYKLDTPIEKPPQDMRDKLRSMVEAYRKP
jgi:flavin reductase (DIM6/NTAB) family NADH-FMN oxidoreductase RutF